MSFSINDHVRVSAKHLRFMCPLASKGWPTTKDPGKGIVINIIPCGIFDLLEIWFYERAFIKTYNDSLIINEKNTYLDAMKAEHGR